MIANLPITRCNMPRMSARACDIMLRKKKKEKPSVTLLYMDLWTQCYSIMWTSGPSVTL